MTDDLAQRGRILTQRRMRHGIRHITDAAELAGIDRKTVARAEVGTASAHTVEALEAFYDRLDAEKAMDTRAEFAPDGHQGQITFDVIGPHTEWHITASGPVGDADEVRRQLVELLRNMDPPAGKAQGTEASES